MKPVYAISDNMITSIGLNTEENMHHIQQEISGVHQHLIDAISPTPFYGSLVNDQTLHEQFSRLQNTSNAVSTRLEQLFILSIEDALRKTEVKLSNEKTLLILSTTKGNIDVLEGKYKDQLPDNRLQMNEMAKHVGTYFNCSRTPLVVSNACISGVLAQIMAARYIRSGQVDHVVVAGGDISSAFTVSGFQSLKAISEDRCKPYDENRAGINLGEACATIILSKQPNPNLKQQICLLGGASTNDANHISGPSRTGEGLYLAIEKSLKTSGYTAQDIDYISAHGTATVYNDEMESKAFARTNLLEVPTNSLKGYFGHTLGAAGLVESIVGMNSLKRNQLYKSIGLEKLGVSNPMNIIVKTENKQINTCLKTASGFGGCNAALVFKKV